MVDITEIRKNGNLPHVRAVTDSFEFETYEASLRL